MPKSDTAPVFLIGYRGTGKTTVAPLLAERLGYSWADSDDEVERLAGQSIATIFAEQGESVFRDFEVQAVRDLAQRESIVASLGGGAVLRNENQTTLRRGQAVVWLTASVDSIFARLAADATTAARRPNLTPTGGRTEIEAVLAQRAPIYAACATLVIDTEGKTPAEMVDEILVHL